ncbi:thioester domain-containing protein [Streptomyces abyssomicinicus]|uniref:thioester domain-containing protein n=1 Tax=Streptomyces abyssomicinicus TaxID=574929 RepID=UPI00124FACD5|nr:thioester domain-containing protein [Streptomyces abyssomicinicus]
MISSFHPRVVRRSGAARAAAVSLLSGLLTAGTATGAAASTADSGALATPQWNTGGATAVADDLRAFGTAVIHGTEGDREVPAGLFELSVDGGGTLQTYGVDIQRATQPGVVYQESDWLGTSLAGNQEAGRIVWVLRHSYPQVDDLSQLAERAGAKGLTEQDAAAGTQVAVWRLSDGADVTAADPQAERLADYLVKNARPEKEPRASLRFDPPAAAGRPGTRIGPVTVRTGADDVTVLPPADTSPAWITDAKGHAVETVDDGDGLYVDIPFDADNGAATLTVEATTTVPVGRALTSDSRSQAQVVAASSETTVRATATTVWRRDGAVPALWGRERCEATDAGLASGLDVTLLNRGDEDFTYRVAGTDYTLAPGERRTVFQPLTEDESYTVGVEAAPGERRPLRPVVLSGVLDCLTESAASAVRTQTVPQPRPVPSTPSTAGEDLATTGGGGGTGLAASIGAGLVVVGAAVLSVVRQRRREAHQE